MATEAQLCCVCGKTAIMGCSHCSEGRDNNGDVSVTCYCSRTCHAQDQDDHKSVCQIKNARKQLYRGGQLLQEVFLAFQEEIFLPDIHNIAIEGDKIVAFENDPPPSRPGPPFPFPSQLVHNMIDKAAILTFEASNVVTMVLLELIKTVLSGMSFPCYVNWRLTMNMHSRHS
jgi:hypothetical protein